VELLMQVYAAEGNGANMAAVRFGNVVGSIGSVAPVFRRQIEMRGAVTFTHLEVTRYLMTIPEAHSLIFHAGAIGKGKRIVLSSMPGLLVKGRIFHAF